MRVAALAFLLCARAASADPPSAGGEGWDRAWALREMSRPPLAPIGPEDDATVRCHAFIEATIIIRMIVQPMEQHGLLPPLPEGSPDGFAWIDDREIWDWKARLPDEVQRDPEDLVQRYLNTFRPYDRLMFNRADYQADQATCLALIRAGDS